MSRIKDQNLSAYAATELPWLHRNTLLTQQIAAALSPAVLQHRTICLNIHLDLKMIPVIKALADAGARLLVLGTNPHTTRDDVAAYMTQVGAEVYACTHGLRAAPREDSVSGPGCSSRVPASALTDACLGA